MWRNAGHFGHDDDRRALADDVHKLGLVVEGEFDLGEVGKRVTNLDSGFVHGVALNLLTNV